VDGVLGLELRGRARFDLETLPRIRMCCVRRLDELDRYRRPERDVCRSNDRRGTSRQ
jgi:hypothetical protein